MPISEAAYSAEELAMLEERDSLAGMPPPFADEWVLYADVEGFSKLIADAQHRVRLAHRYWDLASILYWGSRHHRALDIAQRVSERATIPEADHHRDEMLCLWRSRVRIFSDSIFVFLEPRREPPRVGAPEYSLDGRFVPHAAASLSRALWEARLPHRGGIAFGKCLIDSSLNVFVGEPIVRAYRWTQGQRWFGISVEPGSIDQGRQDFKDQPFLVEAHAHTADGSVDTLAINCTMAAMFDFLEGAEVIEDRALDGLLGAAEQAVDAPLAVRDRYRETACFWLDHFKPDRALRRYPELRNLAERSSNG